MSIFSKWKDKITHGIGDKLESVKLDMIDKVTAVLGYLIFVFITIFLALAILIFLGIGLGEVFSEAFDSRAGGFFATAGVYVLLILIFMAFRTSIVNAFAGIFIKMLTKQNDEDEDDDDK